MEATSAQRPRAGTPEYTPFYLSCWPTFMLGKVSAKEKNCKESKSKFLKSRAEGWPNWPFPDILRVQLLSSKNNHKETSRKMSARETIYLVPFTENNYSRQHFSCRAQETGKQRDTIKRPESRGDYCNVTGMIQPHLTHKAAEPEMENMYGLHYWFAFVSIQFFVFVVPIWVERRTKNCHCLT